MYIYWTRSNTKLLLPSVCVFVTFANGNNTRWWCGVFKTSTNLCELRKKKTSYDYYPVETLPAAGDSRNPINSSIDLLLRGWSRDTHCIAIKQRLRMCWRAKRTRTVNKSSTTPVRLLQFVRRRSKNGKRDFFLLFFFNSLSDDDDGFCDDRMCAVFYARDRNRVIY